MKTGFIVVDADPGIDDAVALALLMRMAGERLRGVTITYGNCSMHWAKANAAVVLALCAASVPTIVPGAERPLCRSAELALDTHGTDGLGYARITVPEAFRHEQLLSNKPECSASKQRWAPDVLIDWAQEAKEQGGLTLICLGPLTNLSLALARDRESLRSGVCQVVIMGGSAGAPGNTTPVSEFNFWSDPEAARAVFNSGLPLTLVGLDVTRRMVLPAAAVDKLARRASGVPNPPLVQTLAAALRFYVEFHQKAEGLDGCIINDPLAVLLALHAEWGYSQPMHVSVDCSDGYTRGQTICDRYGFLDRPHNAQVYLSIDAEKAMYEVWNHIAPGVLTPADFISPLPDTN